MNCKPGDLAVVVGAYGAGAVNNGHIVEVVKLHSESLWYVVAQGDPVWVWDKGECVPGVPGREYTCPDANLRPISGVPINEEECDECPTTA